MKNLFCITCISFSVSCYVPLNRKGKAVQPFCLLMSLGQFGRMCFNCSTAFSLIGAFVNLCIPTFFLDKFFVSNNSFFSVGNNLCSLLNSFYLISSIITYFSIWDYKKLLKGFVSFILICF